MSRRQRTISIGGGSFSRLSAFFLVATLLVSAVAAVPAAAAPNETITDPGEIDWNTAQGWYIDGDVTKATHNMSWGSDHEAFRQYENDNGDTVSPSESRFEVNESPDNTYSFEFSDVEEESFGAFPRTDHEDSFLDADDYLATTGPNSSELTLEDTTTGDGVEAVRFNTGSSFAAGDVAHANFSANVSIDSDESKRTIQIGLVADTLEAGSELWFNVTDDDGDYVSMKAGAAFDEANPDVVASTTGETKIAQEQVSNLTVRGSGDGTINNIEHVNVTARDGDVDVSVFWFDSLKKGEQVLFEKQEDTDSDDDLETVEYEDVTSTPATDSLETLNSKFDDAVLHDVSASVTLPIEHVPSENDDGETNLNISTFNSSDPSYQQETLVQGAVEVPQQIDLSWSNLELRAVLEYAGDRYITSGVAEGPAADSVFGNASYADPETSFSSSSKGDEITLDSTISTGTTYFVKVRLYNTGTEWTNWMVTTSSGPSGDQAGGGGFWGGGNPLAMIATAISGGLAMVFAALGLKGRSGG